MEITVRNLQKKIPVHSQKIRRIIQKILKEQGICQCSLSVVFVTDRKIHELNKKFLRHDYPTDVLSFNYSDSPQKKVLQGEIIISPAAASRYAAEHRLETRREIELYVIHGILHLLGYDDHALREERVMRRKEKKLMRVLGYVD